MFKLENLKFLVKYNWHDYFNKMTLNYDKCKLNKEEVEDILSGSIISIIFHVFSLIATLGMVLILKNNNIGLNKSGIIDNINLFTFIPIIIPIIILIVYAYYYKSSESFNNNINFIISLYSFISIAFIVACSFGWISSMKFDAFFGIIGLISEIGSILGNLFILTGELKLNERMNELYNEEHRDRINHPDIKISQISVDEISIHK